MAPLFSEPQKISLGNSWKEDSPSPMSSQLTLLGYGDGVHKSTPQLLFSTGTREYTGKSGKAMEFLPRRYGEKNIHTSPRNTF